MFNPQKSSFLMFINLLSKAFPWEVGYLGRLLQQILFVQYSFKPKLG